MPGLSFTNESAAQAGAQLLWDYGELRYLLHPDLQRRIYDFTDEWKTKNPNSAKPIVWNIHRGAGKTHEGLIRCVRRCLKYAGQEVRFCAPSWKQCEEIIERPMEAILSLCPDYLQPEKKYGDFYFRNPRWGKEAKYSALRLVGLKEKAKAERGKRSNMIFVDECRDVDNFAYVVRDVLAPQFVKMQNPEFILSSTPPDSMDHEWISKYVFEAMQDGRYMFGPVSQDKDWTPADDQRMLEMFGSKDSPGWMREMECILISDPERLLVPEFDEKKHVSEHKRPDELFPMMAADGGFVDFFACLYGYVDFTAQKLVVDDEVVLNRKNSGQLAVAMLEKKASMFGEARCTMVADCTPQQLADFDQLYKLPFYPAEKHDPDAYIATLRDHIHKGKVVIHPRCRQLVAQLKAGVRNEAGKIERTKGYGHFDAIMALAYLDHAAPWHRMPDQPKPFHDPYTMHIPPTQNETRRVTRQAIRGFMRPRRLYHG
jgi:hypothetical protein